MLFGPGDRGEPTAQDWAETLGTISYEIVTGSVRGCRAYVRRGCGGMKQRSSAGPGRRRDRHGAGARRRSAPPVARAAALRGRPGQRLRPDPEARRAVRRAARPAAAPSSPTDGVPLHVEVDGPDDAAARRSSSATATPEPGLLALPAPRPRRGRRTGMVFWDQRSHGRSGRSDRRPRDHRPVGDDLHAVIEATTRRGGPVRAGRPLHGRHDDHGAGRPAPGAVRRPGRRRRAASTPPPAGWPS